MSFYPVNLDIKNKNCLVVGGGSVASRKAKTLMECGACVTVVSPEFTEALQNIEQNSNITLVQRPYETHDLEGKFLVIGATDNEKLNRRINADAEKRNMLCNIADVPEICNFILPSIIRRKDLCIAISTSGKSPAFAKKLRKDLEKTFGDEYALILTLMGEIRKKLLATEHAPEAHKPIFEKLIHNNLLEMIKNNEKEHINQLLFEVLGSGYDYDTLINAVTQENRL
ncbi:MAG: bifunctional precorrin-2 dehydrogenase/sirohydrochlorin ferrochelatase [Desulfobacteraceae bacterium]|nr:bifunctional precorrin-2 dehydrogenase/sirohydrochlorin ferrochelatase [Desulfobacteraceae bacterium]MBC2757724.1 bifunctional precorrin-2 dehydrogenase/sirohydrochlorin ferrochelatase [Desulfobacteraceae bacterium]